ncbi:DNA polymerase eta [Thamnophis elegans]|uniref:DNA polymerase eta n=1 Tax=Thamnophis elegans TaxID=35005 RepID=UPI0013788334|nr:DNA polymerase eta [Thamnophis elegans]
MVRGQERVVALADMDCFYIQVERRLDPRLHGKPCVVVQYKTWKGGGIIAVSYEARAFGVKRNMWAADAKKLCPDLELARVPEARGKADLTRYREASIEVMEVMSRFAVIERASIDEAYLDLTQAIQERLKKMEGQPISAEQLGTTYIQGFPNSLEEEENTDNKEEIRQRGVCQWLKSLPFVDPSNPELQLTVGAAIMEEMRAAVESATGFQCSVGISHNKVLAKLACGLNKPNRQTLVSQGAVPQLFSKMPIGNIRNLGGKLGASITECLGVQYMGELIQFSESQLQTHFGEKTGSWLYELCRGIDSEPVKARQLPKSIGCSKNFPGRTALVTQKQVQYWLLQLALELEERLNKDRDQNNRVAKQLSVGIHMQGGKHTNITRCCALSQYEAQKISRDAFALIQNCNTAAGQQATWSPPVTLLQLCVSKFTEACTVSSVDITSFLTNNSQCTQHTSTITESMNAKFLESPKKETSKKAVNAIEMLFQRAAKRKQAQAIAEHFVPGVNDIIVPPATQIKDSQNSSQVSEGLTETSNPNVMQKQQLMEQPLQDTTLTGEGYASSSEMKILPGSFKEENVQTAPGLLQEGAVSLADPSSMNDCLLCEKCNQRVAVWEFSEHLDYHFAVELQNSFSGSNSFRSVESLASPMKEKNKSREQRTTSAKRPKQDGMRTLDFFFKPLPP